MHIYIILYCIILYYIILYYIVLYYRGINCFDIIKQSENVLTTGQDRKISLWDLRQPNLIKQVDTGNNDECFSLKVSNQGNTFVTGGSS